MDWVKIEGLIWDVLSSLDETGEDGTYRGQDYQYFEAPKTMLSELCGLNFRLGENRRVLEQLVSVGVVVARVTGDRRTTFYSLPTGMTKDEFFTQKAAGRFAYIQAKPKQLEQAVKAPERHVQPLTAAKPVNLQGEVFIPAKGGPVTRQKLYEVLAEQPDNAHRESLCLRMVHYSGSARHSIREAMNSNLGQFRAEGRQAQELMDIYIGVRMTLDARETNELDDLFGVTK